VNANDVMDAYITDVARRLPRKQRNDVAFELRALLHEELQAQAEATGRQPDTAMAVTLVQRFGSPSAVAARYQPTLTVIDPTDGPAFVRATVIGLAVIWGAGLLPVLQDPTDLRDGLGQWWQTSVIPSLWWPGVLVVWFGLASWSRRRWPPTSVWTPRDSRHTQGSRAALALGLIGIACGALVLMHPAALLDVLLGGRAAPAAYEAFTYTDTFRQRQAPILLALILLNIPLLGAALLKGHWTSGLRRTETGLSLLTCLVLSWTVLDTPVVVAPASDEMVKTAMVLIVVLVVMNAGIKAYRSVKPAPNQPLQRHG